MRKRGSQGSCHRRESRPAVLPVVSVPQLVEVVEDVPLSLERLQSMLVVESPSLGPQFVGRIKQSWVSGAWSRQVLKPQVGGSLCSTSPPSGLSVWELR